MEILRLKIKQLIEDLENETENRHMNDMKYGRYNAAISDRISPVNQ